MKAKYFKRLRQKVKYHEVCKTSGLFGHFDFKFKGETVLALSHKNACERYNKRNYLHRSIGYECKRCWAYFKVKLKFTYEHNELSQFVRFHYSGKIAYIQYIHQLQNLYFALTNTELIYKH